MLPELFRIGPVTIYSYGALIGLGILGGVFMAYRQAPREGIKPEVTLDFGLAVVVAGLISSRLVYVALNWADYAGRPTAIIGIGDGQLQGLSVHGALLGGVVVGGYLAARWRLGFWPMADLAARPVALGMGVGRLGCVLAGCCYGQLSGGSWGVTTPFAPGVRHPSQVYEAALLLVLVGFLTWYMARPRLRGRLFALFVAGSGVARFLGEIYRESERILLGFSLAQLVSVGLLVTGVIMWYGLSHGPLVNPPASDDAAAG